MVTKSPLVVQGGFFCIFGGLTLYILLLFVGKTTEQSPAFYPLKFFLGIIPQNNEHLDCALSIKQLC